VWKPRWLIPLALGLCLAALAARTFAASWWSVEPVRYPPGLDLVSPQPDVEDEPCVDREETLLALLNEHPFRVGGDVTAPVLLDGPKPRYTDAAIRARFEGKVILEAVIDEQGRVVQARVLKPLPLGLNRAALDAVKSWRFKPATYFGHPVKVYYTLTADFTLPR